MEKKYTVIEWLNHLSESFTAIEKIEPFCAIWLIACGIELMGKCLHNDSFTSIGNSSSNFNAAIAKIPAFYGYRKYPGNLYKDLRCGLAHAAAPDNGLLLKRKGENEFDLSSKKKIISSQQFLSDFIAAVRQIQSNEVIVPEGRLESLYIIIEEPESEDGATTGSTNNNIYK